MSKLRPIGYLALSLGIVAFAGYGTSAVSLVLTLKNKGLLASNFCARSECVDAWFHVVEYSLLIAKATSDFLVAVATIGGIIVALLSYLSNLNNSALSNHIAHYGTFQSYVEAEIAKRDRVAGASIDTFNWYNNMFAQSRTGNMSVSAEYLNYVIDLGSLIKQSNEFVSRSTTEPFRFKPHQERMIKKLREIGIEFVQQPRLEFYEIEDQVISLIVCVNQAFCSPSALVRFESRIYM